MKTNTKILSDKTQNIIKTIKKEMSQTIVGQKKLIDRLLVAILTRGHILLESVPGLAKTTAIDTLSKILQVNFQRIQFTPDLLPSDLIGSKIFNPKNNSFYVKKGPIFTNFVLADEINRSPAKVQSALLEAMQERRVTIGEETFEIKEPFFVMATQNPIEQEGTYTLPEAQVDRFLLKTIIDYPNKEEELQIINQAEHFAQIKFDPSISAKDCLDLQIVTEQVYMDESIKKYIINIIFASRYPNIKDLDNLISYGASPRASIGLMKASKAIALLNGRAYVTPEDIKEIAPDILRHRIVTTYEAEAENINSDDIIKILLDNIKVP